VLLWEAKNRGGDMVMQKENQKYRFLVNESIRLRDELQVMKLQHHIRERMPGDKTEAAAQVLEKTNYFALMEQLNRQLADTERAIEKMNNGTYGLCDSCGRPIPPARLEIIPQAAFCLDCKDARSKK